MTRPEFALGRCDNCSVNGRQRVALGAVAATAAIALGLVAMARTYGRNSRHDYERRG